MGVRAETGCGPRGEAESRGPAWPLGVWGPEGWCGGPQRSECQCVSLQGPGRRQTPGVSKVTGTEAELLLISVDTFRRPARSGVLEVQARWLL